MSAVAVVLLETFCCLGLGAAALRALGLDAETTRGEQWTLAFAVGFGILGWLMFPLGVAGYLGPLPLTALLTAGALGTVLLKRGERIFEPPTLDGVGAVLVALLAVVLAFDLAEGLAPPADADTLAYHFPVPARFIEAGRIEFIPEALTGAAPFVVQLTYVPALALGGERALTLWTMLSGWMPAALLFALARRHLGFNWSLAVVLIFLTTPAVIYGGGTGQVETRITLFVMVAAWGAARAVATGRPNYALVAGLGAGFFAAAKYTGLLFTAAAGLMVTIQRRWLSHGLAFAVAMLAAGFQWYAWNAIHTGDPTFPVLFQWLGRDDLGWWSKAHDLAFKQIYFPIESPLPKSPLWLLGFPFKATVAPSVLPDAGRVGLGPFGLLLLPFAALGVWRFRDRARRSPLFVYAALAALFYVAWFFFGGSQRVRHLLPVLPLLLICVTVAAHCVAAEPAIRRPLLAAVAATLVIQIAGHAVFAINYFKFLAHGESREAFLTRNVNGYAAVPWINANLGPADRVYTDQRQLIYGLNVPQFFGSPQQASVELDPQKTDLRRLYWQLHAVGITHLLLPRTAAARAGYYTPPLDLLARSGCLKSMMSFEVSQVQSRTLPGLAAARETLDLHRLEGEGCLC